MHTFKPGDKLNYPTQKSIGSESFADFKNEVKKDDEIIFERDNPGSDGGCWINAGGQYWIFSPSDLTPKSEVFKVRVVKLSKLNYWYIDQVGKIFNVTMDALNQDYLIVDGEFANHSLSKSDCEIVTDQNEEYLDELEDQLTKPTSLPFTEELFNQGKDKYDVYAWGKLITDAHIHGNLVWGRLDGKIDAWQHGAITLREKEVVVYFNIDSTGASGAKFKSIQEGKV